MIAILIIIFFRALYQLTIIYNIAILNLRLTAMYILLCYNVIISFVSLDYLLILYAYVVAF